jgi:N-acetylneuraminic acid mutarotase
LGPAAGLVQIYDPALDSWRLGAPMPYLAGLATATLIGDQIYLAGGVIGGVTTAAVARYDPLGNSWTSLPALPQGRHYASAGTDGSRLFLFGGREGPLAPGDGTNTVQMFDPLLGSWVSSTAGFLTALPQARAGMGRALFAGDEFYLLGGETVSGAGANPAGVYDRVDIYNPATNSWRPGPSLPAGRHGHDPVLVSGRIYLFGGATATGPGGSSLAAVYNPVSGAGAPTAITSQAGGQATRQPWLLWGSLVTLLLATMMLASRRRQRHAG